MTVGNAGRLTDHALVLLAFVLPLSIAASEIALGLAVVSWLFERPWAQPRPRGWNALLVATLALVAAWLLASAFATDPWASLLNVRKLWSIVLVFVVADRAAAGPVVPRLVRAALAGGVVSALLGLGGVALDHLAGTGTDGRMRGVFATAMTSGNVFALLALAALGVVAARPAAGPGRPVAGAAFAVLLVGLFRTFTRSSWLGFVAGASVLLARTRPRWLLAGAAVVALVLAFGPATVRDRVRSIGDPTYVTNQGRLSLWKSGLAVLADHPWTGVGLADHSAVILRYRRPDATFPAGHFHNNLVQVAASTGTIGFVAWAGWMGLLAVLLVRGLRGPGGARALAGLAVWVAFQVAGLFDWAFGDAEVALQLYLWTGLGLAREARNSGEFGELSGPDPVRALSGPGPAA